jgi:N-acetylglutamate synthase-like GNAT family acetyltransferase
MIRQATKHDKTQVIQMMQLFRAESHIEQYKDLDNVAYWNELLDNILAGQGVIYIQDNVGLIMGLITPTIWCNKTLALHELAWYVKPEYRNTTTGYRLLKAYVEYGKQLKAQDRIKMFTITKMVTSPDIKYGKFGFTKLDENWVQ